MGNLFAQSVSQFFRSVWHQRGQDSTPAPLVIIWKFRQRFETPISPITESGQALVADPGAPGLREKLIKIGAKVVRHSRYVFFQMAEVAVPKQLFRAILERIRRLRPPETVPG